MRPAFAIRDLPTASRIQLHHYGKAHSEDWAVLAKQEMAQNTRYQWHEEIAHYQLRQVFQRSHLLVLPSRMEGGANVISEAVMAGLPIIASNIEGSIGLLGENYAGYYPVEDEHALRSLLLRAENDAVFYQSLIDGCAQQRPLFTAEAEQNAWQKLLDSIV